MAASELDLSVAVADPAAAFVVRTRRAAAFTSIALQLAVMEMVIVGLVLVLIEGVDRVLPGSTQILRMAVAGALGLFAVGGLVEGIAAVRSPKPPPGPAGPLPPTTAIIAAYLPNEASIILDTVTHHLRSGPEDLQLIVAYNTPADLPVEFDLACLAGREPRLTIMKVEHSRSKAENVNAALEIATGDIVGVFDSDHRPAEGSYERAWRWLASGFDVVQGRCAVQPYPGARASLLSHVVAAEFEQMYTVGHPGRTRLHGFGLFGGSNGFWRVDALRAIKLDPSALTEDIDASMRLLLSGGRIIADPGIVSSELPPPSMRALCHQRLRWAQGWFQVRRRHLAAVVTDRKLAIGQRLGAFWLFGVGTAMAWIGALVLPLSIDGWLNGNPAGHSPIVALLYAFGSLAFLLQVGVAYKHALPDSRRARVFGTYVLANAIFYAYLRVALVRLSHLHELGGRSTWRVTPRS